jgi:hypothetical protein
MGNRKVDRFEYDRVVIELWPDNDNLCIYINNRNVADTIVCLPDEAFLEFEKMVRDFKRRFIVRKDTKQERFRNWLRKEVKKGRIPGPKECKDWLGHQNHSDRKHGVSLGHPYTRIRTAEFLRAGYKKHETSGRWYKPR